MGEVFGYTVTKANGFVEARGGEAFDAWEAGKATLDTYPNRRALVTGEYHLHGKRGAHYVSERVVELDGSNAEMSDRARIKFINANNPLTGTVSLHGNYSVLVGRLREAAA